MLYSFQQDRSCALRPLRSLTRTPLWVRSIVPWRFKGLCVVTWRRRLCWPRTCRHSFHFICKQAPNSSPTFVKIGYKKDSVQLHTAINVYRKLAPEFSLYVVCDVHKLCGYCHQRWDMMGMLPKKRMTGDQRLWLNGATCTTTTTLG